MKNFRSGFLLLAVALLGCQGEPREATKTDASDDKVLTTQAAPSSSAVASIVANEERVLELTVVFQQFERSILGDSAAANGLPMSSTGVETTGAPVLPIEIAASKTDRVLYEPLPLTNGVTATNELPLQGMLKKWTSARFGILKGVHEPGNPDSFVTECSFEGTGMNPQGEPVALKGQQTLGWKRESGAWVLAQWDQQYLKAARLPAPLFTEVLGDLVKQPQLQAELRQSIHEEWVEAGFKSGKMKVKNPKHAELPDLQNSYQYPCVSVADVNGDGLDDLFVSSRLGRVHLLLNSVDETFSDKTIEFGLSAIDGFVNNATFADFDNDGDVDLFLGRTLERSAYFENDGETFVDRTEKAIGAKEIYFVSSASATDLNRDGLLDLYLCTYAPTSGGARQAYNRYYTKAEFNEIAANAKNSHRYINLPGPPNIVLMNRGNGSFQRAEQPSPLRAFRSSFQAVWSDIDGDGDDDCYLCNDFAPDAFLRNDTRQGAMSPLFTDISKKIAPDITMGFGMGASWGDYDADGDLDLYVSNMYSKAGKRIIAMSGEVDQRIKASAQGNFLYERRGNVFEQVAGKLEGQVPIHKVGWSFGGQFADFDNDGKLDLYVPSGYYSAPKDVATNVDL